MNLYDTFPPRNLSPESTEWGRRVEEVLFSLANGNASSSQSVSGLNRTTASSLEDLARQLRDLDTQVKRIDEANRNLPAVVQGISNPSNFAVPVSGGWNTVASVSVVAPKAGTMRVSVIGSGMLRSPSTSTNMEASARVVLDTLVSPAIPGNFESPDGVWRNSFYVPWGWNVSPISAGQTLTFSLQVNPVDGASWPGGSGSYAILSVNGAISAS